MRTRNRRIAALLLGFAAVLALGGLRVLDPYPVAALREIGFDVFQRLDPRQPADLPVRVVDIDEASLAEIGQWPWPRDVLAKLNRRLAELGAAVVAYDVLFAEPDRADAAHDTEFAASMQAVPTALGFSIVASPGTLPDRPKAGFAISGTDPRPAIPKMVSAAVPLATLADAATGIGALSLLPADALGVVRRLPLLWSNGTDLFPTLAVESLRLATGVSTLVVLGETGSRAAVEGLRIGDVLVPTTPSGDLWLKFRQDDPALYVPARDILGDGLTASAPRIAGHIVLVGTSAAGLYDRHSTPLGENVPGVSIHAQAIEQLLTGEFLTRSDWVAGLEIVAFAIAGIAMVGIVLSFGPLAGLLGGGAIAASIAAFAWYMFAERGVLVDATFPLLGAAAVYSAMVFLQFVIADADKRQFRRAFGQYVSPSLLAEIERTGDDLKLGGEVRELSVMFADVRDFTSLGERLPPERIVGLLNTLFGALGAEIVERSGTIDKFVGDAVMAFWNAPVDVPEHARKACAAALGMRESLNALNVNDGFGLKREGLLPGEIHMGTGVATGDALVGNMGLESRFDYSCVGDTVNVAARIEGICKQIGYDIVISAGTQEQAPEFAVLEAGSMTLKGKRVRQKIFVLVGGAALAETPEFMALRERHDEAVRLMTAGDHAREVLEVCIALSRDVEPGLIGFYELMVGRGEDFLT